MSFFNPLPLTALLAGSIFILAGYLLKKFPPKKINWLYGCRTRGSMKSQERWDFSQAYSARELIKWGLVSVLVSVPCLFIELEVATANILGVTSVILFAAMPVVNTERQLKFRFKNKNPTAMPDRPARRS